MKVSSERIEGCRVELNVDADLEEMEKALDKAYRRLVNKVVVPGFRKGKAPRSMLERHIGRESLVGEALDHLVPELYRQAIKEKEIDAIADPELEVKTVEPLAFKAIVPVRPVATLGDYRSIRITAEPVDVPESKLEEALDNLRHGHASWEIVEREVRFGDMVVMDVQGTVEGNTMFDNKATGYRVVAGSPLPIPGFSGQLVDMKAGDEKEFTLPFPPDYSSKELAGKDCQIKVKISEVKEERLPELTDEFVKGLKQELETVDQLRERIANNLRTAAERESRAKLESQAIEEAVKLATLEFPTVLVEQEMNRMAHDQLMRLGGMKLETYLGYRGLTEEAFQNELRPLAEKKVTSALVLGKIFEAEKIEVSDDEVNAEVERMVQSAGDQAEQMREVLGSPQARSTVRQDLLTGKTIDRLVEIVTGKVGEPEAVAVAASVDPAAEKKEETHEDSA